MKIRDRIVELRRVPASSLAPNPRNWRRHPKAQADALRGVLAEIGIAGAVLAREREDGVLELIDGHLRAETLIAAEQLGRRCYGMEISPAYCDVIVKRWETLTGKQAKRG